MDTTQSHRAVPFPVLTAEEVAELLRVHVKLVRELAQNGLIPNRRVGRSYRFSELAVRTWLDEKQGATVQSHTRGVRYERPPF